MATYPNAIPSFLTLQDGVDTVVVAHPNDRAVEIVAIATELGTNPKGSYADVKTRLNSTTTLGAWDATKSTGTNYKALTDGWVIAYTNEILQSACSIIGYSDANAAPTTIRDKVLLGTAYGSTNIAHTVKFPVRKDDYWRVDVVLWTATVYWIPVGA